MFLHLSVILFTGGVVWTDTSPLEQTSPPFPWADLPLPPKTATALQTVRILLECIVVVNKVAHCKRHSVYFYLKIKYTTRWCFSRT